MRCPKCRDDYEDGVVLCADCGVELLPEDEVDLHPAVTPPEPVDAHLGRFHPAIAERVSELLYRRGIPHSLRAHDNGTEILVEHAWRDELRTDFALRWSEVFRGLDEDMAAEVRAGGGNAPGWYDAPRGGHVDRHGRTVLHLDGDEADADASRVIGPVLVTAGAISVVAGWYLLSSAAIVVAGIGLVLVGVFTPR